MGKITKVDQIQNLKLSKAVMQKMSEGDNVNINYAPVANVTNVFNQCDMRDVPLDDVEQMLWAVIETLPEPKLANLRLLAVDTVVKKFSLHNAPQKTAAKYLTMYRSYLCRLTAESNKRKKLNVAKIEGQELPVT